MSKTLPVRQAFSAIGQPVLMNSYIKNFGRHGIKVAQALLTKYDFENRQHFLNTRDSLLFLIKNGVVPIINENDVTSVYELQFGDNDRLAAQVANIIDADILVLMTDVVGLYDKNPKKFDDAKFIAEIKNFKEDLEGFKLDDTGTYLKEDQRVSFGGMKSKVLAAHNCQVSGIEAVITDGNDVEKLINILTGENIGTRFLPTEKKAEFYKKWIIAQAIEDGVMVDDGADRILKQGKSSLLAVGIKTCVGNFHRGDIISIYNDEQEKIGFGLSNFESTEVELIKGHPSEEYYEILGFHGTDEVIHKDNLVVI
jgi:glutamate 5-kinase